MGEHELAFPTIGHCGNWTYLGRCDTVRHEIFDAHKPLIKKLLFENFRPIHHRSNGNIGAVCRVLHVDLWRISWTNSIVDSVIFGKLC